MNSIGVKTELNNEAPLFSVIMPTYNRAFCIKNAIQSLLEQTYQKFELIIVDDGSTDGTEELIQSTYAREIETRKIIYKKLKKNRGVCHARNIGLKMAKNPWICYLDTDNKMLPSHLRDFANAIVHNPFNKTFYACFKNINDGRIVGYNFSYELILAGNFIDIGVFCHHKSLVKKYGNFDTKLKRLVDWDLVLRYIRKDPPYFINKVLLEYSNDDSYGRISASEDFDTAKKYVLKKIEKINLGLKNRIFSFKNLPSNGKWYRVIWFLGIKISFRNKRKEILEGVSERISLLEEKFDKGIAEAFADIKALQNKLGALEFDTTSAETQKTPLTPPISQNGDGTKAIQGECETVIPVVLSSDENYAPYMYVTLLSVLENADKTSFLDFYLLVPDNFPCYLKSYFFDLQTRYKCSKNFNINFINMGTAFSDLSQMISHITNPTYYRLKMAEMLPEHYKKAIYLDTDVIVEKDLSEYFNTDLGDNFIAGVKAAGYLIHPDRKYYREMGLDDLSQYINAGVTLWNLEKVRNENMVPKLSELAKNNYRTVDQDVVNIAFYNNIKHLPLKYNLMTKYAPFDSSNSFYKIEDLTSIFGKNEIDEALKNPVIIHFASKIKPWNNEKAFMADIWWKYAAKTPFYTGFLLDLTASKLKKHS